MNTFPETEPVYVAPDHEARAAEFLASYGPHHAFDMMALAALIARTEVNMLRLTQGGNHPPAEAVILPEKLVDAEKLPAVLAGNYGPLAKRSAELSAAAARWLEKFAVAKPEDWPAGKSWPTRYALTNDTDNNRTSDFLRQLGAFAGGRTDASGEVHEARVRVTAPLDAAKKAATAWFDGLRSGLRDSMRVMESTQTAYLLQKAAEARREREAAVRVAQEEARRAAEAARELQGDEDAVAHALHKEEVAEVVAARVAAPIQDSIRSTSAGGVTTSLRTVWKFNVAPGGIMALAKAVVVGEIGVDVLTTNDSVINAIVKAGRREIPGLEIYSESSSTRTGARG